MDRSSLLAVFEKAGLSFSNFGINVPFVVTFTLPHCSVDTTIIGRIDGLDICGSMILVTSYALKTFDVGGDTFQLRFTGEEWVMFNNKYPDISCEVIFG